MPFYERPIPRRRFGCPVIFDGYSSLGSQHQDAVRNFTAMVKQFRELR
jgi:hypothetical protein